MLLLADRVAVTTDVRHRRSQRRPAGLLGDPLRLRLAGQQQRLRLRRLHRLRAAQARQPRRVIGIHVRDLDGRHRDAVGRYVPHARGAGARRRLAHKRPAPVRPERSAPTRRPSSSARRGRALVAALTFFPALAPRPDRPRADRRALLMRRDLVPPPAVVLLHARARRRLPAGRDRRRAGRCSPAGPTAARSSATGRWSARSCWRRSSTPAYFQPRPSQTGYSAAATSFSNLGPNEQALRISRRRRGLPPARAALHPGGWRRRTCPSTRSRPPPRASTRTSPGERAHPGPPRGRRRGLDRWPRPRPDRGQHRRPLRSACSGSPG